MGQLSFADVDPLTGGPLLFKEVEAPASTRLQ